MSGKGGKPDSYAKLYGIERPPPASPAPRTATTSSTSVRRARELGKLPAPAQPHTDEEDGDTAHVDDAPADATHDDDQTPDEPDATHDDDEGDQDDGGEVDGSGGSGGRRWTLPTLGGGSVASAGAGWILGVLLWGWVVLPFVKGGPAQVSKTLRAKFLNQAPDGSALP